MQNDHYTKVNQIIRPSRVRLTCEKKNFLFPVLSWDLNSYDVMSHVSFIASNVNNIDNESPFSGKIFDGR